MGQQKYVNKHVDHIYVWKNILDDSYHSVSCLGVGGGGGR